MTPTAYLFLWLWLVTLAAFAVAMRALRRPDPILSEQRERIERLFNENARLREREQCRRVFGTDPVTTDEFGAPVG